MNFKGRYTRLKEILIRIFVGDKYAYSEVTGYCSVDRREYTAIYTFTDIDDLGRTWMWCPGGGDFHSTLYQIPIIRIVLVSINGRRFEHYNGSND